MFRIGISVLSLCHCSQGSCLPQQPWLQLGRATEKSRRAESAAGKGHQKKSIPVLTAEKPQDWDRTKKQDATEITEMAKLLENEKLAAVVWQKK